MEQRGPPISIHGIVVCRSSGKNDPLPRIVSNNQSGPPFKTWDITNHKFWCDFPCFPRRFVGRLTRNWVLGRVLSGKGGSGTLESNLGPQIGAQHVRLFPQLEALWGISNCRSRARRRGDWGQLSGRVPGFQGIFALSDSGLNLVYPWNISLEEDPMALRSPQTIRQKGFCRNVRPLNSMAMIGLNE